MILRSENIEFVVSPYEADAQLAYLSSLEAEKGGIVDDLEDDDLLAYGCPTEIHLSSSFLTGMCVLAGCDFLPSVPGIGITKAYSLVSKYRNLDRVRRDLRLLQSTHTEEIVSSPFQVIHGTKPKQKVQLLER
ncbi:Exonuclease 1 [Camellia lanceoleosa]|uniref:Exonuclease 1 n=1 Tax=Camellia lanceoleosa TaxID=1840588 RepID=A0ACC0G2Y9_9ERIC|nr:Exonuclease 1 [Camellia lanceoleosa]